MIDIVMMPNNDIVMMPNKYHAKSNKECNNCKH